MKIKFLSLEKMNTAYREELNQAASRVIASGWSPLIVAAYHGNHRVVNFLLKRGELANDESYNGTSVLMYEKDFALKAKDKTTFDRLIEVGEDVEKKDFYGKCLHDYPPGSEANFLGIRL